MNGCLLSVSDDLSTQQIQVNCYTFRVKPNQVTWRINPSSSSYLPINDSELLNSTEMMYRHSIILNESFSNRTNITCTTTVNGETEIENYTLQGMSEYSIQQLICSSLVISIINFVLSVIFIAALSPPPNLSATILSSSSINVSWTSVSNISGYIIHYSPNEHPRLKNRSDTSSVVLYGLSNGTIYNISVYSYKDLPSTSSSTVSVLLGG